MTALDAALSRLAIPGTNSFANWNVAQRVMRELNATGCGEFVTEYSAARGAVNFSSQHAFVTVILKPEG